MINVVLKPEKGIQIDETKKYLFDPSVVQPYVDASAENATKAEGQANRAEQTFTNVSAFVDTSKSEITGIITQGKTEINTAVDEGRMDISDTIEQAVEDVKAEAVAAAEGAIQDAANTAIQIATDHANTVIKPELQTYVDSSNANATIASNSADAAMGYANSASTSATNASASATRSESAATRAETAASQASQASGKIVQLGFDGAIEDGKLVFKHAPSGVEVPYELLDDYEYEVDMLYDSVEELPSNTPMIIKNGANTITFVSALHRSADEPATVGDMAPVMREVDGNYRWLFKAAYKITPAGKHVLLLYPVISSGLNNPFSLLDYKWSEYELSNASWLLSNGQFNSGATYVAVYDLLLEIYNGTVAKEGVSVKLSTEAYEDTDFVLNTADTTFRLPIKVANAPVSGLIPIVGTTNTGTRTAQADLVGKEIYVSMYTSGSSYTRMTATDGSAELGNNAYIGMAADLDKAAKPSLKLYFYVGETIQDANIINASGVLTRIAEVSDNYISAQAMPSDRYIDLTLGASGSTYTAPANGYFYFNKVVGGDWYYVELAVVKDGEILFDIFADAYRTSPGTIIIPVRKGDTVVARYNATGATTHFRFIYAEGEN